MKKYSLLLILLLVCMFSSKVGAQTTTSSPANTWTYPAVTALNEQVTWYFDMTGSGFIAGEGLFLWDWSPTQPYANWSAPQAITKLTYVGNMVWSFTLTPTVYFNTSVSAILASPGFWMLLKDSLGTIITPSINMPITATTITSFATSGAPTLISPSSFYVNKPLSILVNVNEILTNNGVGGLTNDTAIYFNSGLNDFDSTATNVKVNFNSSTNLAITKFKNEGNGIFKFDMIPYQYYNVSNTYSMNDIAFTIMGPGGTVIGTALGGANFTFLATPLVPLAPVLTIFPTKFSQKDIVVVNRTNNESTVSQLTYALTAGTQQFNGTFVGTSSSLSAYIDLLTLLAGQSALATIHLHVTDNTGRVIIDTDIPLVPLSQLD